MDRALIPLSKKLSWLLRHGAGEVGLPMDAAGWTPDEGVLKRLRLRRPLLEEIVRSNTKRRLQLEGERIRCCQGHSTETMPVTQVALEASWARYEAEGLIWHGTRVDALDAIHEQGLRPVARTHVHLAAATDSVVGKRAKTPVMLAVSLASMVSAAQPVWSAPNGVLLARRVPRACIVGARAMTRRARAQADWIEDTFGAR